MAKKQKSERASLIDLISKQQGISKKSASSKISRVVSDKSDKKKAQKGLTDYAKKKFNKVVTKEKAVKESKKEDEIIKAAKEKFENEQKQQVQKNRVNYGSGELHTLKMFAQYDFYKSDNRERPIMLDVFGDELNDFMNAPTPEAASEYFKKTNNGQFLKDANIKNVRWFEVDGVRHAIDYFED